MSLKKIAIASTLALGIAAATSVQADYIEHISETFQSGATFNGVVTLDNSWNFTAVAGTLTGYDMASYPNYQAGTSSPITSIGWTNQMGSLTGAYLNDSALMNWIYLQIDHTNPAQLALTPFNFVNNRDDSLVSGTITSVAAAVPEPEEWALMLAALPLVFGRALRNNKSVQIPAAA
jgi:hypothetical protein